MISEIQTAFPLLNNLQTTVKRSLTGLATETNGDSSNYLYSFSLQLVGISIRFINWLFTSFGGEWNRGEQPVYERDTEEDGEQN